MRGPYIDVRLSGVNTDGIYTRHPPGGKHLRQRLREHSMLANYPTSLNLSIHSVEPSYFFWQKVGSCTKTWSNVFLEHEDPAPLVLSCIGRIYCYLASHGLRHPTRTPVIVAGRCVLSPTSPRL